MEKQKAEQKVGKVFLIFAGICIVALPLIVYSAFSFEPGDRGGTVVPPQSLDFDHSGKRIFQSYDLLSKEYLKGISTERTLNGYYSLRQYIGSPPYIPHRVEDDKNPRVDCLVCHAKGGWTEELKRHTPITPHPENISCTQCHVQMTEDALFIENTWVSVPPPRLGRSYLPGAPPPIPHDLQRRGNCVACHVGPGAVTSIRTEHPSRGNCRQCHVPDLYKTPFHRKSGS